MRSIIEHNHIPLRLTILACYRYQLLAANSITVRGHKRIFVPSSIGLVSVRRDAEREIKSLTARITVTVYCSEPECLHEIAGKMLSLHGRLGALGLKGEHDVVWLAGEVCTLPYHREECFNAVIVLKHGLRE